MESKECPHTSTPFPHAGVLDSGQAEVETGVAVSEAFVIKPHQVHNGGVKIAHMDWVLDGVHPDLIRRTVNNSRLDAGAGQPGTETRGMVLAALQVNARSGAVAKALKEKLVG